MGTEPVLTERQAYIAHLRAGETVSFRESGSSMMPRIKSRQKRTYAPRSGSKRCPRRRHSLLQSRRQLLHASGHRSPRRPVSDQQQPRPCEWRDHPRRHLRQGHRRRGLEQCQRWQPRPYSSVAEPAPLKRCEPEFDPLCGHKCLSKRRHLRPMLDLAQVDGHNSSCRTRRTRSEFPL